ncbi:MAG: transcription termination factor Rho [Pseudomonadales bacterium]|jgi:transcription termination factor Rho|nr:transcription termination factor Rho [Pseudomonadales bacterium]
MTDDVLTKTEATSVVSENILVKKVEEKTTAVPKSVQKPEVADRPKITKISKGNISAKPAIGGNGNNLSKLVSENVNGSKSAENSKNQPQNIKPIRGILDTSRDGHGVIRGNYGVSEQDVYIASSLIRRYRLRPGDELEGLAREPKDNERYHGLSQLTLINGVAPEEFVKQNRVKFQNLTPVYPDEQINLETDTEPISMRIVDLIAPIGKGQRSLVVSPPKAGKTTLLKEMSTGIAKNYPDIHLMAVLIGERPEEVTDMRRHIEKLTKGKGEVAASNFDEPSDIQCSVAELALERAKRLVEQGKDVVILLDSITRLARAYNLSIPTSGRTLSGGFDPAALFPPKRFFGAARNFETAGSLTIIGTALVDTGSRMDDLVYEEFKGTGNQEIHLDRHLAERRIHPAIEVQKSGTRRDDLLIDPMTYQAVLTLHRMLDTLDKEDRTATIIAQMKKAKTNKEFLASLRG